MNFYDKQNKIKILQELADEHNAQRENLMYTQNIKREDEADEILRKQYKQQQLLDQNQIQLPTDNNLKVNQRTNNKIGMGYSESHKCNSSLKEQSVEYNKALKQYQDIHNDMNLTSEFKSAYESQVIQDETRKTTLFKKDRVGDIIGGYQGQIESVAQKDLKYTKNREDIAKNQDKRHFNKKNELIAYADAYLVNKNFLRGENK